MGCWNKTCGLSNLHITSGTPVYVFVLEQTAEYDGCYATGLFRPLLLPFESAYDDYGGGKNSHGVALDLIMDGIKQRLVEVEEADLRFPVKKVDFDPELFFKSTARGQLAIRGYGVRTTTPVYFTMFRKDIVDDILKNYTIEVYVGNNEGTIAKWGQKEKNYTEYNFSDIIATVRPLLTKIQSIEHGFITGILDRDEIRKEFLSAQWLRSKDYHYSRIVDVVDLIDEARSLGTEAIEKIEPLVVEYLKGIFIDTFMHAARKVWIPGGFEGSQGTSDEALRLLGAATIRVIDDMNKEYNESEDD